LAQAPSPGETSMNASIKVEVKVYVGDTGHNPFSEDIREMQGFEHVLDKNPMDGVEGFPEIHFHHAPWRCLFPQIASGQVLANEDIKKNFSPLDERPLALVNYAGQDFLEARTEQFGDNLIEDVAARYGAEVRGILWVGHLREYNQLGGANERGHVS